MSSDLPSRYIEIAEKDVIPITRQFVDGIDDDDQSRCINPHLDISKKLRDFQKRTNDPTWKWRLQIGQRTEGLLHYAETFKYVKAYIVQVSQIIASRANGVGQRVLRQNAAILQQFHDIVIIIDESTKKNK